MEVLDKGKHCAEEFCHQIDLLPVKCKACGYYYCAAHFKYEAHGCKEAVKFDYKIPTCDLCNQTIEFQRHKDLDLCLAEHMQKCQLNDFRGGNKEQDEAKMKKRPAKPSKKCSFENCRHKRDVFCFECETCGNTYCVRHRIPEDHDCTKTRRGVSRPSSSSTNNKLCSQEYTLKNSSQIFKTPQSFSMSSF